MTTTGVIMTNHLSRIKNKFSVAFLLTIVSIMLFNTSQAMADNILKIWIYNASDYTVSATPDVSVTVTYADWVCVGTFYEDFTLASNTGTYIYVNIGAIDFGDIDMVSVSAMDYDDWLYHSGYSTATVIPSSLPTYSEAVQITIEE